MAGGRIRLREARGIPGRLAGRAVAHRQRRRSKLYGRGKVSEAAAATETMSDSVVVSMIPSAGTRVELRAVITPVSVGVTGKEANGRSEWKDRARHRHSEQAFDRVGD